MYVCVKHSWQILKLKFTVRGWYLVQYGCMVAVKLLCIVCALAPSIKFWFKYCCVSENMIPQCLSCLVIEIILYILLTLVYLSKWPHNFIICTKQYINGWGYPANFIHSVIFPDFHVYQNTGCLSNVNLVEKFYRNFCRIENFPMRKLMNGALVTPTRIIHTFCVCFIVICGVFVPRKCHPFLSFGFGTAVTIVTT